MEFKAQSVSEAVSAERERREKKEEKVERTTKGSFVSFITIFHFVVFSGDFIYLTQE